MTDTDPPELPVLTDKVDPEALRAPPALDPETARRIAVETIRSLDLALKRCSVNLRQEMRREVAETLRRECRLPPAEARGAPG